MTDDDERRRFEAAVEPLIPKRYERARMRLRAAFTTSEPALARDRT